MGFSTCGSGGFYELGVPPVSVLIIGAWLFGVYIYICNLHVCVWMYLRVCMYTYTRIHTYIYMYMYMYIDTYIYTCLRWSP